MGQYLKNMYFQSFTSLLIHIQHYSNKTITRSSCKHQDFVTGPATSSRHFIFTTVTVDYNTYICISHNMIWYDNKTPLNYYKLIFCWHSDLWKQQITKFFYQRLSSSDMLMLDRSYFYSSGPELKSKLSPDNCWNCDIKYNDKFYNK